MNFYNVLMKKQEGVTHFERLFMKYRAGGGASEKELEGVPPLTFKANGEPLISWTIYGNMTQTGTPSPTTPIIPSECGERTENLFDYSTITTGYRIVWATGAPYADATGIISDYIEINEGQQYRISDSTKPFTAYIIGYNQNKEYLGVYNSELGFVTVASNRYSICTIPLNSGCKYIKLMTFTDNDLSPTSMLTVSSITPTEFIPYGYKLDIKSGNTTTPVYLGEVQSTRQIYKYEFTGSETWSAGTENYYSFVPQTYGDGVPYSAIICSHCSDATINNTGKAVFFKKTDFPDITTGEELKQYCADQYSAGTPVTVWYVLATPTTGIVNEPIRKIGDYADSISNVAEIPTSSGSNTLDVDTTLKPSNVYIKYKS